MYIFWAGRKSRNNHRLGTSNPLAHTNRLRGDNDASNVPEWWRIIDMLSGLSLQLFRRCQGLLSSLAAFLFLHPQYLFPLPFLLLDLLGVVRVVHYCYAIARLRRLLLRHHFRHELLGWRGTVLAGEFIRGVDSAAANQVALPLVAVLVGLALCGRRWGCADIPASY